MWTEKQSHLIFSLMESWFGCPWKSFSLSKAFQPYILTGCYDGFGSFRIWRTGGICTRAGWHSGAVTSVCILKPKSKNFGDQIVATASKDKALRLWKFVVEDSLDQSKSVRAFKILRGHTAAVQSVAAEPSGEMVCSGSWDCTINLWNTNASQIEGNMVSLKKRKKNTVDEELQSEERLHRHFWGTHSVCLL